MRLPSNWDSLLYMAVSSCCSKCAHYPHTHTHTLPNLYKHTHQHAKYRRPLMESACWCCLGESRGFQLRVLCMNTSRFLRFPPQRQQERGSERTLTASNRSAPSASSTQICAAAQRQISELQTQRRSATKPKPARLKEKTDPLPAHPVGLPWQRVTWLPLVTGATGPDASGELGGAGGGALKSSRRRLKRLNEDEEICFIVLVSKLQLRETDNEAPLEAWGRK